MAQLTPDKAELQLGVNLVKLCLLCGMYQYELAIKVGYQPGNIYKIVKGNYVASTSLVYRLKQRFPTLNIEWLLFGTGKPFKDGKVPNLITEYKQNMAENKYAQKRAVWIKTAQEIVGKKWLVENKISVPKVPKAQTQKVKNKQ